MAHGSSVPADHGSERHAFEQTLARALRSKGNLLTLSQCAKQLQLGIVEQKARDQVSEQGIVTDIDRGRALWNVLEDAIDRLRPADLEPEPTPAWRFYSVVSGFYVQGKLAQELATELGISPRTLYRERRAAIKALSTIVWQVEQQRRLLSSGNRDAPSSPDDANH
jgi:hypothetical protein